MRFVPAEKLEVGMKLGRPILNARYAFVIREGVTLTPKYIKYIQEHGYAGAYIDDKFSEGVELVDTISPDLFNKGVTAVQEENIGEMENVAKNIVAEILSKDTLSPDVIDLRSFDDYTYHHSVNVAVYASIIGNHLKFNQDDMEALCMAGICHDLGKSKIPAEIINKPGKLTDEEYEIIKTHPGYSFEMLGEVFGISAKVKQAVLYHHENENGSGYPEGRSGNDIPLFSKILHVVDVYDALTSKRPYKEPYSSAEAVEYLLGGSSILFDQRIVKALTESVPIYPPGIEVGLSDGQLALVTGHTNQALRPKVRIKETLEDIDLSSDQRYLSTTIATAETHDPQYAEQVEEIKEEIIEKREQSERKKTVLVVDDMVTSLMMVKAALEKYYQVILVKSGFQAISYIQKNGVPDLVIMDIDMPDLDGISSMRAIRKQFGQDIPVMFLTALTNKQIINQCRLVGAVDYIIKPVKPVYIRERVAFAFGERRE